VCHDGGYYQSRKLLMDCVGGGAGKKLSMSDIKGR